jgi:acetyl esterase/lipase
LTVIASWTRVTPWWRSGELVSVTTARVLAWVALAGATGLLVRGEVIRPELPEGVRVSTDLVYHESGGQRLRLDVYVPKGPAPARGRPVVVAVHGGGWRGGSKSDYGRSLAELARHGLVVVAIDYRLSRPGVPSWPENLDDVRAALGWVRRNTARFSIDPRRVALMGASAGGHLALLAGFDPDPTGPVTGGTISRKISGEPIRIGAVVDFYGPTDLRALADGAPAAASAAAMMLGGKPADVPRRYDEATPLNRVRPGVPPVLILHGSDDQLVPPEQSKALDAALARAGVPHRLIVVDGARHGFGLRAGTKDLVPELLAFLSTAWKD